MENVSSANNNARSNLNVWFAIIIIFRYIYKVLFNFSSVFVSIL